MTSSPPGPDPAVEIEIDFAPTTSTTPTTRTTSASEAAAYPPRDHLSPAAIRADSLRYVRAGRVILDDVSLQVGAGESLAVVGPSGSGKSSLLALLAGLEPPDAGRIERAHARAPGLILQGYGLVGVLTAAENVEVALQSGTAGRFGAAEIRGRAASVLEAVGLTAVADHLVEELSGGQQQRVAIARALVIDPEVLLADELTAELDHDWKERVVDLVLGIAARGGIVLLATHDPDIAARCTHTLRLADGRVTGS
jgi:ABC-type lipoprotein export system ATPase subunit